MTRFVFKLFLFLVCVCVIQALFFYNVNVPPALTFLDTYLEKQADIIYFGDSTIRTFNVLDKDKKSTSEMLQEMLPDYFIGSIDQGAYNMDIYLAYCRYIDRRNIRPRIIIIPINMRSFSPEWDMKPEYQFESENVLLTSDNFLLRAFFKPLAVFKTFNLTTITREQYLNTPVFNGNIMAGRVRNFDNDSYQTYSEQNMKNQIIFYYMYPLHEDYRKAKSMMGIVKILKSRNMKVIFYVTPLDYERGEKYVGRLFRKRVGDNIQILRKLLKEEEIELLDISFALRTPLFDHETHIYINEHMKAEGRKFVALKLYERIKRMVK